MDCQFCKKTFSSKSAVTYHQKTAKYCLKIQGKVSADKEYNCSCGKIFYNKHHYETHTKNCKLEKVNEIIFYQDKIKELEKIIIEKDIIISKLEGSIDVYKEDHQAFVDIAKQPKNTTNNSNKILNIKSSFDFEDKILLENALSNYNLEYFLDGQKGIARFVVDTILRDEENNFKYLCTDLGRSVFKYKDKLGNIQKDYKAQKLTNYLVEGGIKDKVHDISEKWISKDEKVNKNKLELALEKNNEVNEIDKNNNIFKKELASMVVM
jgi:hypothetical protein